METVTVIINNYTSFDILEFVYREIGCDSLKSIYCFRKDHYLL